MRFVPDFFCPQFLNPVFHSDFHPQLFINTTVLYTVTSFQTEIAFRFPFWQIFCLSSLMLSSVLHTPLVISLSYILGQLLLLPTCLLQNEGNKVFSPMGAPKLCTSLWTLIVSLKRYWRKGEHAHKHMQNEVMTLPDRFNCKIKRKRLFIPVLTSTVRETGKCFLHATLSLKREDRFPLVGFSFGAKHAHLSCSNRARSAKKYFHQSLEGCCTSTLIKWQVPTDRKRLRASQFREKFYWPPGKFSLVASSTAFGAKSVRWRSIRTKRQKYRRGSR